MKIEEKILTIIRSNTEEKASVSLGSDLRKDLRLDSFGTLMVLNAIEEAFGIAVDDADFARVQTVSDVIALLRTKYACA